MIKASVREKGDYLSEKKNGRITEKAQVHTSRAHRRAAVCTNWDSCILGGKEHKKRVSEKGKGSRNGTEGNDVSIEMKTAR